MTKTSHYTASNVDPDEAVVSANYWMDHQSGFGMAPDRCVVQYNTNTGKWYITAFLRDDRPKQHFNHTVNGSLWVFMKNLFHNGFSTAIPDASDVMHYFGSKRL